MNYTYSFYYTSQSKRSAAYPWRVGENKKSYNPSDDAEFDARVLEEALRFETQINLPVNHIFQKFDVALDHIMDAYRHNEISLKEKIARLKKLSDDIDHMYVRMEQLGLDKSQFALHELTVHGGYITEIQRGSLTDFSADVVRYLSATLVPSWQSSVYADDYIRRVRAHITRMLIQIYAERLTTHSIAAYLDHVVEIIMKV